MFYILRSKAPQNIKDKKCLFLAACAATGTDAKNHMRQYHPHLPTQKKRM
jgi:hypothetical protein